MDWKQLVQFTLLGGRDLEQYAILLVRVSLGLFFAISGANKLFVAGNRQTMYETPSSPPCRKDFRLSTGSTISSTFRKSCTCCSLSG